jgi:hypothetical protein
MDPRRSYETRPGLSALPGTTSPRLDTGPLPRLEHPAAGSGPKPPQRRPTYGPLLVSSQRWHRRLWLMVAALVLLVIGLLVFAYVFVQVAFPH